MTLLFLVVLLSCAGSFETNSLLFESSHAVVLTFFLAQFKASDLKTLSKLCMSLFSTISFPKLCTCLNTLLMKLIKD